MSEQRRRRLRPASTPRRVGEPNVLSNQAIPNTLSTATAAAQAPGAASPAPPPPARPAAARPAPATDRPAAPAPSQAPTRTLRAPSLSTIIFLGFVLFTAIRFISNFGADEASPTTTTPPPPASVGIITFGLGLGDDCALEQPAETFGRSVDVWWRADLKLEQDANAEVVVRAYRDDGQIERYDVPPEPELGDWDVLCAGEPVAGVQAGDYRVELWDGEERVLLAEGSYTKTE